MRKLTLLAVACAAALSACVIVVPSHGGDVDLHNSWSGVEGDGHVVTEKRDVGAVPGLDVSGPFQVEVRVGAAPSLEVEGDSNLLPLIRTETSGTTLRIGLDGNVRNHLPLRVRYTVPQLAEIHSSGSGRMLVRELNGGPLAIHGSGSQQMDLSGRVDRLDIDVSGSGGVNASGLSANQANVTLTGSGRVTIGSLNGAALNAKVHGSGGLQASGSVERLNANVTGSGDVNLSGLTSQVADLSSHGSGGISAIVRQSVVAQTSGSGEITVYGNPAQRTITGRRVQILN